MGIRIDLGLAADRHDDIGLSDSSYKFKMTMMAIHLTTVVLLMIFGIGLVQIDAKEDCTRTNKLVFELDEAPLSPQETLLALVWLKDHCFQDNRRVLGKLADYIDLSNYSLQECHAGEVGRREDADKPASRANIGTYVRAYNQFYYGYCQIKLADYIDSQAPKLLSREDLNFVARLNGVIDQVQLGLRQAGQQLSASDIRLKAAFLLMVYETDLAYLSSQHLDPALKNTKLEVDYQKLVEARCQSILETISVYHPTVSMIKARSLRSAEAFKLGNKWANVVLLCKSRNKHTVESLFLKYNELRLVSIQQAKNIDQMQLEPGLVGDREALLVLQNSQINANNLASDSNTAKLIESYNQLTEAKPMLIHQEPDKTLADLTELEMFFDKWKMFAHSKAMGQLKHLAMINLDSCEAKELRRRYDMEQVATNPNLKLFASFYNQLQKQLCLEYNQNKLISKMSEISHRQKFFRRLINLVYSSWLDVGRGLEGVDYRLRAVVAYLLRYSSLPRDHKLGRLMNTFVEAIKSQCQDITAIFDDELKSLNAALAVSDPMIRPNQVSKAIKYIMLGAKACNYYATAQINEQLLTRAMSITGNDIGDLRQDVRERSLDITDESLFYDSRLAEP